MPRCNFFNLPSRTSAITKASKNVSWMFVCFFYLQLKRHRGTEILNSAYLAAEGDYNCTVMNWFIINHCTVGKQWRITPSYITQYDQILPENGGAAPIAIQPGDFSPGSDTHQRGVLQTQSRRLRTVYWGSLIHKVYTLMLIIYIKNIQVLLLWQVTHQKPAESQRQAKTAASQLRLQNSLV